MKHYSLTWKVSLASLLWLYLGPVWAHGGGHASISFSEGFVHPWLGADHLMAMFAVGLWARSANSSLLWQLPLCFLTSTALGALLPAWAMEFTLAEQGIASSLVLIGLILPMNKRLSLPAVLPLFAFAGICHGYVHADELQVGVNFTAAAAGFLAATALIHLFGIAIGSYSKRLSILPQLSGLGCILAGAMAG